MFRQNKHYAALAILVSSAFFSGPVYSQATSVPQELIYYPEFVFFNGQVLTADNDADFTIA